MPSGKQRENDFKSYIKKNIYHYSIPLEAAASKAEFERWVPAGFDIYLMEIALGKSPADIAYLQFFENVNEVISSEHLGSWDDYILRYYEKNWIPEDGKSECRPSDFRDYFLDRNVQRVVIGAMEKLGSPFLDSGGYVHNTGALVYNEIDPKYTFPVSDKRLITVGAFPDEYWDIFPHMRWYSSQYAKFMMRYRKESYDIAVIGDSLQDKLKFRDRPERNPVICYQPGVYDDVERKDPDLKVNTDFDSFIGDLNNIIRNKGTADADDSLSVYNHKFTTFRPIPDREPVWREGNILFCNGWILPQHLIAEGLLEVE